MSIYVLPTTPVTNNLTALAGGGVAGATPLSLGYNEVATVVTANDSTVLPPAIPGNMVVVHMTSATATMRIYANQSNPSNGGLPDNIIAHGATALTASGTAITLATGHSSIFVCTTMGQFKQLLDSA